MAVGMATTMQLSVLILLVVLHCTEPVESSNTKHPNTPQTELNNQTPCTFHVTCIASGQTKICGPNSWNIFQYSAGERGDLAIEGLYFRIGGDVAAVIVTTQDDSALLVCESYSNWKCDKAVGNITICPM